MHPVLPISLNCPADFECLIGFRMCMDEIHNVYLYVRDTIVAWLVEVISNGVLQILVVDIIEMALETVHKSTFCLSNILDLADFTGNAVY